MPEITKQDALRWLDMQRDAINTEIAYAAPSDKGLYFGNLKIVNWLADRVQDMTAVEFFETVTEECARHEGVVTADSHPCRGCAFDRKCPYATEDWHGAINIVKRWKEEQDAKSL
jgi:hypothetical protein